METDYLQLRDYVRIVYRRRWIIAAILLAGLIVGVVYNSKAQRVYEGRATLQMDNDPNVLALDRPLVDARDWMREFLPTQLGILSSRDLARMAHEELKAKSGSSLPTDGMRVPSVNEILRGRNVDVVRDTRLVTVSFRSTDPVMAARVANALARAYVQRNLDLKLRTTGEASEWLSKQVDEQRKVVDASEDALQKYREQRGAEALVADRVGTESQNIVVQKLSQLQAEASRARAESIEKQAQYEQLSAIQAAHQPLDTLPAIASNVFVQRLKDEVTTAQRQLAQASKELGERHPDIIKLQDAAQSAERKLQTEIANVVQAIRNDYQAARARDRALAAALERQKAEVQNLNRKAVEYTALEREAATNREVLDKLVQRSREAMLARALQTTNVNIVDSAETPTWPVLPSKRRNIAMALGGSGALAFGLVFLLEIFNTRVKSPEDLKRHLQITVLGMTPQVKPVKGHDSLLLGDGAPTAYTELINAVRTNLLLAPLPTRTLLVTSSEPGEGKTLTAANLALSLARLNQRVLLVDADLRNPRLHDVFGEEQQPGLGDVLSGTVTKVTFRKTKASRVWLLTAGTALRNPADLLGSERFNRLIDMLRAQFDWVVLDSSPVLAVTDPCLIARVVSGVLFVVGCGQTSREVASAGVERLDAAGGRLVGAMLNRVVLERPGGLYLPYYHREYKAYYAQDEGGSWVADLPETLSKGASAGAAARAMQR